MKRVDEIRFGFSDAENYRRRENKDIFNRIFLRTDALDNICGRNTYFLVGEKGTGKTAYAVYLSNTAHKGNRTSHTFIRETDYLKFISLKKEKHLSVSDYSDIWKVILCMLLSDAIPRSASAADQFIASPKFKALRQAIADYYNEAFSPEIPVAMQFVENSAQTAKLIAKYLTLQGGAEAKEESQRRTDGNRFQTNLLYLEKKFKDALASLKLRDNHILVVDGVDVRPSNVALSDYSECVRGLANAIWSLNNDFFPSIRDSRGRMKIVLAIRPDIFNSLNLQNRNTKLRDNAVILDWNTEYTSHRQSNLFALADRMFAAQQSKKLPVGAAWDYYFPFDAANTKRGKDLTSFVMFLRYSFHRPRDVLTMLDLLGRSFIESRRAQDDVFCLDDLSNAEFRRRYSEYLLGEIRDSLAFYYDEREFELFLKFFEFLDGAHRFGYQKYEEAFGEFAEFAASHNQDLPSFMKSPEEFLQFLYDQNVLCFVERSQDHAFIRWCFRERNLANISPKVKLGVNYEIHYGLANALNTGKKLERAARKRREKPD